MNYKHLYYFWWVARTGGVVKAGEHLNITPHTISGQIGLLEDELGTPLYVKRGRNIELTEAGKLAFGYAQDIFALGAELEDSLRNYQASARPIDFRVGVVDAVPKTIACHLIEPATSLPEAVHVYCRESKLESLLTDLAAHRLDLVLSCAPIPQSVSVRAYNHRLGETGTSFFASNRLIKRLKGRFPACLNGAPMLVPSEDVPIRSRLDRWCRDNNLQPRVVGEFDDSALMKAFGRLDMGVFIGPTVIESEIEAQFGVKAIGRTNEIADEFFAISVERRVKHPCVVAIAEASRNRFFSA